MANNPGLTPKLTIEQLQEKAKKFISDRDWEQFHTIKNLSADISVEAAELLEIFLWAKDSELDEILKKKRTDIEHEVADIFFATLCFCIRANIDLAKAFQEKLEIIGQKYPIEKSKGKATKYTEL